MRKKCGMLQGASGAAGKVMALDGHAASSLERLQQRLQQGLQQGGIGRSAPMMASDLKARSHTGSSDCPSLPLAQDTAGVGVGTPGKSGKLPVRSGTSDWECHYAASSQERRRSRAPSVRDSDSLGGPASSAGKSPFSHGRLRAGCLQRPNATKTPAAPDLQPAICNNQADRGYEEWPGHETQMDQFPGSAARH